MVFCGTKDLASHALYNFRSIQ